MEYGNWEKLSTKHSDVISSMHTCTLNCDTIVLLITKILNWIQNSTHSPSRCWYHSLEVKINSLNAKDCTCLLYFYLFHEPEGLTFIDEEAYTSVQIRDRRCAKRMFHVPFQSNFLTLKIPFELKRICFHFLLQKVCFQLCEL